MENKKTALIVEGGGQRGVFSFGITDTFIKRNYDPFDIYIGCLLYTSPSPRDPNRSRMPSSA